MVRQRIWFFTFLLSACGAAPPAPNQSDKSANSTIELRPSLSENESISLKKWRGETIALPPEFAPDMEWQGQEELLFAPGMFKPEEPDFFSYAFVLRYPGQKELKIGELTRQIEAYYRGLMLAVASDKEGVTKDTLDAAMRVSVRVLKTEPKIELEVRTFDSFATMKQITLRMQVTIESLESGLCVRAEVSPKAKVDSIWKSLHAAAYSLDCEVRAQQ